MLLFDEYDLCCVAEYQLPTLLVEQVHASVEDHGEVADDELLRAVVAIEQTESEREFSDDELLAAVVNAEKNC